MPTIKQHIVDFFLFTLFGVTQGLNWGNFISASTGVVAFVLIVVTIRLRLKETRIKQLEIDKREKLKDLEEEDDQD